MAVLPMHDTFGANPTQRTTTTRRSTDTSSRQTGNTGIPRATSRIGMGVVAGAKRRIAHTTRRPKRGLPEMLPNSRQTT